MGAGAGGGGAAAAVLTAGAGLPGRQSNRAAAQRPCWNRRGRLVQQAAAAVVTMPSWSPLEPAVVRAGRAGGASAAVTTGALCPRRHPVRRWHERLADGRAAWTEGWWLPALAEAARAAVEPKAAAGGQAAGGGGGGRSVGEALVEAVQQQRGAVGSAARGESRREGFARRRRTAPARQRDGGGGGAEQSAGGGRAVRARAPDGTAAAVATTGSSLPWRRPARRRHEGLVRIGRSRRRR